MLGSKDFLCAMNRHGIHDSYGNRIDVPTIFLHVNMV